MDARHHRHWQEVLGQVAGLHLSTVRLPLPVFGTVLGGTMELHGNNISLACFHGINFKSKSWALFSLKEPCISFATEAQEVNSSESKNVFSLCFVRCIICLVAKWQNNISGGTQTSLVVYSYLYYLLNSSS